MPAPAFMPPLAHPALDGPLVVTDGFGERRSGHFHAGVDLSTGERVGKPVYAPVSGWVERVRASGIGYGRSIYVHGADGRLIQLGHLDAFDEPLASFVAAKQESTAQYEQDLWPSPERFRVTAGKRLAWSGESGAGPPHLHVEIRVGDMAMNPLRAGLPLPDTRAPELRAVTLEPLDDASFVERSPMPWTGSLGASGDTVVVLGRLRVWVASDDGFDARRGGMATWSTAIEWAGATVECRFDSVSWATDMAEADFVYQGAAERLSAPAGMRPRVLVTSEPRSRAAGIIAVAAGDAARPLRVTLADVSGNTTTRTLWLRGPRAPESAPDTSGAGPVAASAPRLEVVPLPGEFLRLVLRGGPSGLTRVRFEVPAGGAPRAAARVKGGWCAIVRARAPWLGALRARGVAAGRPWTFAREVSLAAVDTSKFEATFGRGHGAHATCRLPSGAAYEEGLLVLGVDRAARAAGLTPVGETFEVLATTPALRRACALTLPLPKHARMNRVGLYHGDSGEWEFVRAWIDSARGTIVGESRQLGTFALFEDREPPTVAVMKPAPIDPGAPYSRWALEARVLDRGCGVDAFGSRFMIDGHPVPSEWDLEAHVLRWRPRAAPAGGAHRYAVTVSDRVGNTTRKSGRFVID